MYLCIDTISSAAGITLANPQSATHFPLNPQNSSDGIIPAIDKALKKTKSALSDLDGVFVIKGPGSFTGLRVGLSVANQFAHQLKIPIIGLRTDEWWLTRTDQTDATYLQSMNKAEVYVSQSEKSVIKELEKLAPCIWLGQLSGEHRARLSKDFTEIKKTDSIEGTWQKLIRTFANPGVERRTYDLVEPFYGKDPSITKSKRQISI
ncbi:tRNA (adenosine(37)-N6)-threonylcarbamoyltransferase complex dimerization subunit type 1 TsaB [Patescibacteria group bacterium]|nr:tRNA (adenosine(37)-N6)-threonylcarbamoyltransferase complex dimerization subunit type 1 TsaB [Patescibacteria group bacterium]MBU1015937.1 tRNA (adenosine(37)-N6)-threonylcarbamoyltransferase complex dimerization subunit type 1 TsaB [Patescibacteria group bacterium]MBU1685496.1 tRNA (adenosine(37)-N6)-threonylcarbamoyltransferase complex dimerization subunit type 1 TsaB [Patescibacteria group bacterium]MBU1938690.1 tRNA (adenosine(37)-N6)-threonylcarbamoyltransferase complex dimerization sub